MSFIHLEGKYALVTGGSHGIGLATAKMLAGAGCSVAICSRTRERLDDALSVLQAFNVDTLAVEADVLNPDDIQRVQSEISAAWPALHILVNNVGGGGRWGKPIIEDTPANVWQEVYQKNTGAAIAFTQWAIPMMRSEKWGRVINVSSIYGHEGGGRPWFTMAKSAQIAMMKTLAMTPYLVRDGITFNTVAPGSIMIPDTGWEEQREQDPEAFSSLMDEQYPLGRLGTPEEVAAVIHFLCQREASLVNGACIVVDGGESSAF